MAYPTHSDDHRDGGVHGTVRRITPSGDPAIAALNQASGRYTEAVTALIKELDDARSLAIHALSTPSHARFAINSIKEARRLAGIVEGRAAAWQDANDAARAAERDLG